MGEVVVETEDGQRYIGEYDGYGRVGCAELGELAYGSGDEFSLRHRACWEAMGRPGFTEQSPRSPNQGFYMEDGRHEHPEPKTAEDVAAIRVPDDYESPEARYWRLCREAEGKALEASPTCECGEVATVAHTYHSLTSTRDERESEEDKAKRAHDPASYRTSCGACKDELWKVWKDDYDKVQSEQSERLRAFIKVQEDLGLDRITKIDLGLWSKDRKPFIEYVDRKTLDYETITYETEDEMMEALRNGKVLFGYTDEDRAKEEARCQEIRAEQT